MTSVLTDAHLTGRFAKAFVAAELAKQIEWSECKPRLLHYRTAAGAEVDFVLETGEQRIAGVEVKLQATLESDDFKGLRSLAEDARSRFAAGVVLHTGAQTVPFGERLWAVPIAFSGDSLQPDLSFAGYASADDHVTVIRLFLTARRCR